MATELELLKAQLAELAARIARIESGGNRPEEHAPADVDPPADIVLAISAAVAAYLGERAHIRSIRLVGTSRWTQQGRLSIQASHRLH
jgi:methylmalonyl-CoA carboxyltransferase 12S subunit